MVSGSYPSELETIVLSGKGITELNFDMLQVPTDSE